MKHFKNIWLLNPRISKIFKILKILQSFSSFLLLSRKQPAGTTDPPSGILGEMWHCKSEYCITCTMTEKKKSKHFQSFHWKQIYRQQRYSEQLLLSAIDIEMSNQMFFSWRNLITGPKAFEIMACRESQQRNLPVRKRQRAQIYHIIILKLWETLKTHGKQLVSEAAGTSEV